MNSMEFPMRGLFQICGFVYIGVLVSCNIDGTLTLGTPVREISSGYPRDLGLRHADEDGDGGGGGRRWRWCLICSGAHPDNRECELTPRHVTSGPGKMNCTRSYCTTHVRYQPSAHLVHSTKKGINVPKRVLTPSDFEVVSIARGCEDRDKGNTCVFDHDLFGITCYSTCAADFCNGDLSRPQWKHLIENDDGRKANRNNVVDTIRSYVERTGIKNTPKDRNEDSDGSRVPVTSLGSYKESDDDENEAEFQLDEGKITEHKTKKHASKNNNNNNNNSNNNNRDNNSEGKDVEKSTNMAQYSASGKSLPNPGISFLEKPQSSEFQISDDDDDYVESPSYEQRGGDVIEQANGERTGGGRLLELRERRSHSTETGIMEDEINENNLSTSHSPMYSLNKGNPASSFAYSIASPTVLLVSVCSEIVFASFVVSLRIS